MKYTKSIKKTKKVCKDMLQNYGLKRLEQDERLLKGLLSDVIYFGKDSYAGRLPCKEKNYGDATATATFRMIANEDIMEINEYALWNCSTESWAIGGNYEIATNENDEFFLHFGQKEDMLAIHLFNGEQYSKQNLNLQLQAYPILIDYFERQISSINRIETVPLGMLWHNRRNERSNSKKISKNKKMELPYEAVLVKGKVIECQQRKVIFNKAGLEIPYYCCTVRTKFGPLPLIHTLQQVRYGQGSMMKAGTTIFAKCVLWGRLINKS